MKERILMKRLKGLMALTVAFMLMFGSSLTVLAATTYSMSNLQAGQMLQGGDELLFSSGSQVYIGGVEQIADLLNTNGYTLPSGYTYEVVSCAPQPQSSRYDLYLTATPIVVSAPPVPAPSGGSGHLHTMEWIIGREPTETQDGLYQYKCTGCDYVEAQQPITYFGVIIKKIIKAIEEAPENGTVIIDNEFLRCFTDEIVAALLARPDVTVDVRFTEGEVAYRFLVPAGQAPTDGQEWYGYFYLGGVLYGWQAPVTEEEA